MNKLYLVALEQIYREAALIQLVKMYGCNRKPCFVLRTGLPIFMQDFIYNKLADWDSGYTSLSIIVRLSFVQQVFYGDTHAYPHVL